MEALAQYEPIFGHAVRAAWCEYPGLEGLERMRSAWKELTGKDYPYRPGCSTCMMNLVRDCGTLYFAAKEAYSAPESAEVSKTTAGPRKCRKSPKK